MTCRSKFPIHKILPFIALACSAVSSSHHGSDTVGDRIQLVASFGAAINGNTNVRLLVGREAGRLYDVDEDDANIFVKLGASRKFHNLPEGRRSRVAALRSCVRPNPAR